MKVVLEFSTSKNIILDFSKCGSIDFYSAEALKRFIASFKNILLTHLNTTVYVDLKKEINDERLSLIIVTTNHEALEIMKTNLEKEETEDGMENDNENEKERTENAEIGFYGNSHKYNSLFLP